MKGRLQGDERRYAPGEKAEKGGQVRHIIGEEMAPRLEYVEFIDGMPQLCFQERETHPLAQSRGHHIFSCFLHATRLVRWRRQEFCTLSQAREDLAVKSQGQSPVRPICSSSRVERWRRGSVVISTPSHRNSSMARASSSISHRAISCHDQIEPHGRCFGRVVLFQDECSPTSRVLGQHCIHRPS